MNYLYDKDESANTKLNVRLLIILLGYILTCPNMGKRTAAPGQSKYSNSISWK